jgi:HK97 gp10 family phage protein
MAGGSVGSVKMDLSFKNTAAVIANLYKADVACQEAVVKIVHEAGEFCRELAFFLCPVDTQFMRDHIKVLYGPKGFSFEVGWLEDDFLSMGLAFYPIYQEFGTIYMSPQPCLSPAYQETKPWFLSALGVELAAAFERRQAA